MMIRKGRGTTEIIDTSGVSVIINLHYLHYYALSRSLHY